MNNEPEIQDVELAFLATLKTHAVKLISWTFASLIFGGAVLYFFPDNGFAILIALLPGGLLIWYVTGIKNEIVTKFYEQFAKANGYTHRIYDPNFKGQGALFSKGFDKRYDNIIYGKFENHPIVIFNFRYTYGLDKNKRTYYYTVFEIDYDRVLPKMYLKAHKVGWYMAKPNFNDGRRLKLAHEFEKHFDLFCEEKFEIEALQVFTPDIMHKLMTDWNKLTLEFVNDKIYIYARGRIMKKRDLISMYELGQYLIEKLAPVLKRMESSVIAMKEKY